MASSKKKISGEKRKHLLDKMNSAGAGTIISKELLFEFGTEGGGAKVYRYTISEKKKYR